MIPEQKGMELDTAERNIENSKIFEIMQHVSK